MRKTIRQRLILAISVGLSVSLGSQNNVARAHMFSAAALATPTSKLSDMSLTNEFKAKSRQDSLRAQSVAKRLTTRHNPANFEKKPKLDYRKPFAPKPKGFNN